jgi:hypothetical protein
LAGTPFANCPSYPDVRAYISGWRDPTVEQSQELAGSEMLSLQGVTAAGLASAGDLPSVAKFDKSDNFRTIATVYEFGKPIKSAGPSSCAGHSRRMEFWK